MKNYKISIDFSVENDVAALTRAAELAKKIDGVVALVGQDKMIRVDETGMIVAVIRTQRQLEGKPQENGQSDLTQSNDDNSHSSHLENASPDSSSGE